MKKIFTLLIVSLSAFVVILGLTSPVYATVEDDYYNLLFDLDRFDVISYDSLTPGTYEILYSYIEDNNESYPLKFMYNGETIHGEISLESLYGPIKLTFGSATVDYILIYDMDTWEQDDPQDYTVTTGDSFEIRTSLPWTNSYSYGRIKNFYPNILTGYNLTPTHYWDASAGEFDIGFRDSETDEVLISPSSFTSLDLSSNGPIAAWSSPLRTLNIYTNGTSSTVANSYTDALLVVLTVPSYTKVILTIYYLDDGEITKDTVELTSERKVRFEGEYRSAISGEEHFIANVDNLVPLDSFLEYIAAWDDIYGDISDQVYIEDDGGYESDVVGVYDVVFAVEDSEGNESTLASKVHVVDIVAPVITGTSTPVNISYNQDFNVSAWVASLSVSDNYYTGLTISIQTNTYSSNKTTVGSYTITVKSTDPSGNVGTLTRTINVQDGVGPVFTGPSTITASINEHLTVEQIKASLAATDAKDGNVTASITVDSDGLTGNETVPGTYTVIFKAQDSVGNQTFHTVTARIVSNPPGFYVIDGTSVRLLPGSNLTVEQILSILGVTEGYSDLSTNYDANKPGTYALSFRHDGTLYNLSVTVLGQGEPGLPPPLVVAEPINNAVIITIVTTVLLGLTAVAYIIIKRKKV